MKNVNIGWQLVRSVSAADNPAIGATTMDYKPPFAHSIRNSMFRGLEFIVAAKGSDNGVVAVKLWAGRGEGGPAKCIAAITWTIGTMQVKQDPQTQGTTDMQLYGDTAVVTSYWPLDVNIANSGNNMLCSVSFDGLDSDWIAVEVLTLTDVTKANIYIGAFE